MQIFKVTVLVCLFAFFAPSEEKCKDDNVCVQMKTHGMWSADCYDGNFKKFPQCLRSDIEIIDLSYNRLRKITREDLQRYTSLKMLYLSDNLLTKFTNSTFEDMDKLQVLDLSVNAISELTPAIFHLPSLKRLYLSQNQNINIIEAIDEATPITSPLEVIDIGFNDLETLPNLGVMPHLTFYNISGNNLLNMEVKDIAGLCNLKTFVNNNFTTLFDNPCDCWNIQQWLQERQVKFTKIPCDYSENECPYNISQEHMSMYNDCIASYSDIKLKTTLVKIGIAVGVVALVLLLIIIYFLYRRRKQRKSKLKRSKLAIISANGKKEIQGLL